MMRSLLLAGLAALALAAPALAQTIAITGAKVIADPRGAPIENGVVVMRDGKILSVGGAQTAIPAGAERIDASGRWVTTGIIAAFSRAGLVEIAAEDSANDTRAAEAKNGAALDAFYAFDPASVALPVTRIEGVTRIAVAPAAADDIFAGYGLIADTSGAANSVTARRAFVYAELGEGGASRAGGSRPALWARLLTALEEADRYPQGYDGPEGDALLRLDAKALQPVARGQVPLVAQVHRAADIRLLIDLKRQRPALKLILTGASEAWMVASELAAAKIPVLVDPIQNLPESFEQRGATLDQALRLAKAGAPFAIAHAPGSDDEFQTRLVLQIAGNAVANGLSWGEAFAAITSSPAAIFGLPNHGQLAPGKAADVVIWDGDPLEVMTAPIAVYIDGKPTSMTTRQTKLRDRYHPTKAGDQAVGYRF
ncbi:MAG TPA: amidohydrolase [Hyphomonadaceae bacterium]|nr:amidohydrolase [Hyphomonadaceae bacterium]